jgi:hypothetical protein
MARNRKNGMAGVRLAPAAKAILLCILIGGSGVGYVLQKNKIYELGRQIAKREAALEQMRYQNKISGDRLASLHRPDRLAERVKELRLGLVPPHPGQWIYLAEIRKAITNGEPPLWVVGK